MLKREPETLSTPRSRQRLAHLIARLLRPLALLSLREGMTIYEFHEITRWVFVRTAMDPQSFSVAGRNVWRLTKSRCAVLTGMTRRQVDRLVNLADPPVEGARAHYHRGVRVLTAWQQERDFIDAETGLPRVLPLRGEGSFERLTQIHSRDIPMRAMLDELEQRGCVDRPTRGTVRFLRGESGTSLADSRDIEQLEQIAERFLRLIEINPGAQPAPAFLEAVSPTLGPTERDQLKKLLLHRMENFMREIRGAMATPLRARPDGPAHKVALGIYFKDL